jgi:hypothetical protein
MATQNLIVINHTQFAQLIEQMKETDWSNIWAQVIVATLAVGGGAYAQYLFEKNRKRQNQIDDAYRFNEAVAYIAATVEEVHSHIEGLIWPELPRTKKCLDDIRNAIKHPNNEEKVREALTSSFTTIRSFEVPPPEYFISKISSIGAEVEIVQARYRLHTMLSQFKFLADGRNERIQYIITQRNRRLSLEEMHSFYSELHDVTYKMLLNSEAIFDTVIYISTKLRAVAKKKRYELEKSGIKGVKVAETVDNTIHTNLLKKLKELFDADPASKNRLLHMKEFEND